MPNSLPPTVLLVDNGSQEPAATLALRTLASKLGEAAGGVVRPVSLLHSSAIAPELLAGQNAEIFEPVLRSLAREKKWNSVILPFFIGPSGAIIKYLPERVQLLRQTWPQLNVRVAPCLVDTAQPTDCRMALMLAERVRAAAAENNFTRPAVAVVDHGTPEPAVNAVRELVTTQLRELLGAEARIVAASSMERRPGTEFDFNEPLLARLLDTQDFSAGEVVVARLFLLPGRHAGPGGDVEKICRAGQARHPHLKIALTEPLGTHPGVVSILMERLAQGLPANPV